MADPQVRVDIVVGKNSVVPALDATSAALVKSGGSMVSLSRGGVKQLEVGFRALALQATGVPGPLGKIAEGALLLGGGSGVLLGVAVAAGAVALAWQALTKHSRELAKAITDLQGLLPKNDAGAEKQAQLWKEYGDMIRRAGELERKAGGPGAMFASASLLADAAALREKAAALKSLLDVAQLTIDAMGGSDRATGKAPGGKAPGGATPKAASASPFDASTNAQFTADSRWLELTTQAQALNAALAQTPLNLAAIEAALAALSDPFSEAGEKVAGLVETFGGAFQTLSEGIGASVVGMANFGEVMLKAGTQAIVAYAQKKASLELAEAAASFASGLWPPNPLAIAAGVKHLAAAAAFGALAGAASSVGGAGGGGGGGGVSGAAARGGVDSKQMRQDQQGADRGTLTVTIPRDAVMHAGDPVWQEFMADTMKKGAGRNVAFRFT